MHMTLSSERPLDFRQGRRDYSNTVQSKPDDSCAFHNIGSSCSPMSTTSTNLSRQQELLVLVSLTIIRDHNRLWFDHCFLVYKKWRLRQPTTRKGVVDDLSFWIPAGCLPTGTRPHPQACNQHHHGPGAVELQATNA